MIYTQPRFLNGGDRSLFVEFGDEISPEVNARVFAFRFAIRSSGIPGIVETVPAYRSLLIYYDPLVIGFQKLRDSLQHTKAGQDFAVAHRQEMVEIPTVYGGEYGPDLEFVARHNKLTAEEVITIHSGSTYLVYMIGFMPGFPYLGGMSEKIATPRLQTPRLKIPAGSVGIAGNQTGVYPVESPGGWQIIGRTPLKLFDPVKNPPAFIAPGGRVKFKTITSGEFQGIQDSA